jgi:hypothetical protein
MMALAWADPSWQPDQALELKLWREATTIHTSSGPGGCDPYGLALTLRRRGLDPEIHVSHRGPYFLDTVRTEDQRRVMRVTQEEFRREANEAGIPTHLTRLPESALMASFDAGAVAIILVCGYHMVRRRVPHWIFAFGHEDDRILVHDPAAVRDPHGDASAPETYAVGRERFARAAQFGPDRLSAAILIRKGSLQ